LTNLYNTLTEIETLNQNDLTIYNIRNSDGEYMINLSQLQHTYRGSIINYDV